MYLHSNNTDRYVQKRKLLKINRLNYNKINFKTNLCEIYRSALTETVHVLELNIGINGEIFTAVSL